MSVTENTSSLIIEEYYGNEVGEFTIEGAVTIGLFEDMRDKIESIIKLIDSKHYPGIESISRGVVEIYFYMHVILSKEHSIYCRSYYVDQKLKDVKFFNKLLDKSPKGNNLRNLLNKNIKDIQEDKKKFGDPAEIKKDLLENYSDVFEKRKERDNWYNLDGRSNNLHDLCVNKLDKEAEYELIYRVLSSEIHAQGVLTNWEFKKNEAKLKTSSNNYDMVINTIGLFFLEIIRRIYDFYGFTKELKDINTNLRINYKFLQ